jgi:hypothetical protein
MQLPRNCALILLSPLVFCLTAAAQQGFGPLDPTQPKDISVPEIIQRMGARETEFAKARDNYVFRQAVKVDTLDEDTGKIDGEYQQVTDITFNAQGKRDEHVVFAPQNTLERIMLTQQDLDDFEHGFPFVLLDKDLPDFDIQYLGRQRIDELDTYVFQAAPKHADPQHRNYQGKVWVDQQDFQIVMIDGKIIPDDPRPGHGNLSPPFATYYEQVDGKYWFPTYTKAEGNLHFPATKDGLAQDVHVKMTIRYTDYKQFRSTSRIIFDGQDITDKGAPATSPPPAAPKK